MRIIAGQWRSRKLVEPDWSATRPMPDRLKQSIFDMLGSFYASPGGLPPLRVADVFAGSGSMGLEALSRGARICCFYERDRQALAALRENIAALNAHAGSEVITGDAWREATATPDNQPFDLIFLDPPYRDSQDSSPLGKVQRYLRRLAVREDNRPLVVLHHEERVHYLLGDDEPWHVHETRRMGTSRITLFLR